MYITSIATLKYMYIYIYIHTHTANINRRKRRSTRTMIVGGIDIQLTTMDRYPDGSSVIEQP